MRDGQECTISLIRSFQKGTLTFYELQLHCRGETYLACLRYSTLRNISAFFPNSNIKFPQPRHFTSLISQLTGNNEFLERRQQQLTVYFQNISKLTELKESKGLKMILEMTVKNERSSDCLGHPPSAPRICGKKLVARVIEEEI